MGGGPTGFTQLRDALANGHLDRPQARQQLQRARQLAERAVALAPDSAAAHKALGFVAGAQRAFEQALASYRRAVALDADAWGAMINIGDVLEITGRRAEALPCFERAYAAMARSYGRNPDATRRRAGPGMHGWASPSPNVIAMADDCRRRKRGVAKCWRRHRWIRAPRQGLLRCCAQAATPPKRIACAPNWPSGWGRRKDVPCVDLRAGDWGQSRVSRLCREALL